MLVVDDEHDLAATCQRLLHRRGWVAVIACSRQAALEVLAHSPRPELAIVDRQLPDGYGLEVLRAAVVVGTPVIMVTGYGSAATRRLALEEGAAGFLAKPFTAQELNDLVDRVHGDAVGQNGGPPKPPPAPGPSRPGIHC